MPTYTYRCQDCGNEYDAFQTMKEEAHTVCPDCNGKVLRLIGAGAGILFKGSGFYVNDYRSSNPARAATKENGGTSSSTSSSSSTASNATSGATTKGSDSSSTSSSSSSSD